MSQFITYKDKDGSEVTLNVAHIVFIINPSMMSNMPNAKIGFAGGVNDITREEAIRLKALLGRVDL